MPHSNNVWLTRHETRDRILAACDQARATKDLDIVMADTVEEGQDVREDLIEALSIEVGAYFTFQVSSPRAIAADQAGRPGWRFAVTANLAGKQFQDVRVKVVARPDEVTGTEILEVPTTFAFADLPRVSVEAVDRRQQFAEKLHRDFALELRLQTQELDLARQRLDEFWRAARGAAQLDVNGGTS